MNALAGSLMRHLTSRFENPSTCTCLGSGRNGERSHSLGFSILVEETAFLSPSGSTRGSVHEGVRGSRVEGRGSGVAGVERVRSSLGTSATRTSTNCRVSRRIHSLRSSRANLIDPRRPCSRRRNLLTGSASLCHASIQIHDTEKPPPRVTQPEKLRPS